MPTKQTKQYPQLRVTPQAREHLEKLLPAIRLQRGLNTSMTDLASEAILSIPMPIPAAPQGEVKKRRTPKRETAQAAAL